MEPLTRITVPTVDVLNALIAHEGPTWGLAVIRDTGRLPGTVYPLLERLERLGWLVSSWEESPERPGPRRRLYDFTAEGKQASIALIAARAQNGKSSLPLGKPRPTSSRGAVATS
ncbi:MAG: PadR family transcriptional regulator [Alphaproteobacteria bacterium]|nr:MAG: PadR family transcriptional regulator [Alphaproteobacteria bacterium]